MLKAMILHRYLFWHYLKLLLLVIVSLIAILMTARIEEIARFASLGAPLKGIFLFALYQLPYIFPIVLPISALVGSMSLMRRLAATEELTAMRAGGFSFRSIFSPLLLASLLLSLVNFYVVSELATRSHLKTRELKYYVRMINPFLLLQNKHLATAKGVYAAALGPVGADAAEQLLLAFNNKKTERMQLFTAERFAISGDLFRALRLSQAGSFEQGGGEKGDNLYLETIQHLETDPFSFPFQNEANQRKISNDYLKASLLLKKIGEQKRKLAEGASDRQLRIEFDKSCSELVRRVSIALAVFSFSLMGSVFGAGRDRRRKGGGLLPVASLAALFLISYFAGKSLEKNLPAAALLYLGPHLVMLLASLRALKTVEAGSC